MNKNVKILDCTLRDGGYTNDWNFGEKNISEIIQNLAKSGIEYIECGYLNPTKYSSDKTIFNSIQNLEQFITNQAPKYTLMINYGECDINSIPNCTNKNIGFRVVFRKNDVTKALDFCQKLKTKGYFIFINPMVTDRYTEEELLSVISKTNKIMPVAFSIVDSFGVLSEEKLLELFYLSDKALDKNIALGFHSHNNLQLSFSNAKALISASTNRELIIDSTVYGIGRGAGNLCTELITQYLNETYNTNYDLSPIIEIINDQINLIPKTWGYSVPYYFAAINHCHPNYAKYLIDKNIPATEDFNQILKSIPDEKKDIFDMDFIEKLYITNFDKNKCLV